MRRTGFLADAGLGGDDERTAGSSGEGLATPIPVIGVRQGWPRGSKSLAVGGPCICWSRGVRSTSSGSDSMSDMPMLPCSLIELRQREKSPKKREPPQGMKHQAPGGLSTKSRRASSHHHRHHHHYHHHHHVHHHHNDHHLQHHHHIQNSLLHLAILKSLFACFQLLCL